MKKRIVHERVFECPDCQNKMTAWKKDSRRTSIGHIKDMYCPFCKAEKKFIQVSNY